MKFFAIFFAVLSAGSYQKRLRNPLGLAPTTSLIEKRVVDEPANVVAAEGVEGKAQSLLHSAAERVTAFKTRVTATRAGDHLTQIFGDWVYGSTWVGVTFVLWLIIFSFRDDRSTQPTPHKEKFTGDFKPARVWDCLSTPWKTWIEACCCYHFMWAENVGKTKLVHSIIALGFVIVMLLLGPWTWGASLLVLCAARVYVRHLMRQRLKQGDLLHGAIDDAGGVPVPFAPNEEQKEKLDKADSKLTLCTDSCGHFFVPCCLVYQETEFVELSSRVHGEKSVDLTIET